MDDKLDFLIWDNYVDKNLLLDARQQAEILQDSMKDAGYGKEKIHDKVVRSDKLIWITDLKEGPLA